MPRFSTLRLLPFCAALLCCLLGNVSPSHAQSSTSKIPVMEDSRAVIQEGIALHDKEEYASAMAAYRRVPEGDTNYVLALNEMLVTSLADTQYSEVLRLAKIGLRIPGQEHNRNFILYSGHAYDYLKKTDSALACYDTLRARYPYDHQPWYERAALFFRQKKYDSAIASLQHSLMLNPWHFRSHNLMGAALSMEGRLTEAWLATSTALFTTSDPKLARVAIDVLSKISNQSDEIAKAYAAKAPAYAHPLYDEIDPIINAKLALSRDYTYESDLAGDAIINTLHAVMEKLVYDPADKNFVMQYYVPLYTRNFKNDRFDPFMLHMFGGYGIEKVERLAKKQKSDVKEMANDINEYFSQIVAAQQLPFNRQGNAPVNHMFIPSEGYFVKGVIASKSPLLFGEGPVQMYQEGALVAAGTYNAAGKKQGIWKNYFKSGLLESAQNYTNGVPTGRADEYNEAGVLIKTMTYDAAGEVTESFSYTANGVLSSHSVKKGERQHYISYHPNGRVEYETDMKNGDVPDGLLRTYYDDGATASIITFKDGKRDGPFKSFYRNGGRNEESIYVAGKRDGPYYSWHESGKPHYKAGYSNGKLDGPYEEYDSHGRITSRGAYHNGKKKGDDELIDAATGATYGVITYKSDLPVAYRFMGEGGKVLAESDNVRNRVVTGYYYNGAKMNEIPYKDGKAEGTAKYFYKTGGLSKTVSFVEDKTDGVVTEYYHNGKKRSEQAFKEDEQDGYYRAWHPNGQLSTEGFMKGGTRVGQWRSYTTNGKIEEEMYYTEGDLNGPEKNYFANGKLRYIDYYRHGILCSMTQYDTAGRELAREDFPAGNGRYRLLVEGSKMYSFDCALKGGLYDGPYTKHWPDGTLAERGHFIHGRRDSLVESFYPTGTPLERGYFAHGDREGLWKSYERNGSIGEETNYQAGQMQGLHKIWDAGMLRSSFNNFEGDLDSISYIYGDGGKVACVLRYDDGALTGYASADATGHATSMTPVINGTAHILTTYPGGGKAADLSFDRDTYDGQQTIYYSNGKPAESRLYSGRDLNGPFRKWTPDGRLIYDCTYVDDDRTGTEKVYDNDGKPLATMSYADGGVNHGKAEYTEPKSGKKIILRYYYGIPMGN